MMAYRELVKNFEGIRAYMREFYVYGFKNRNEYHQKSARSYDDERRRVESWLGEYMGFRQTPEGKNVFLSLDSRLTHHNPFYQAWKARSFTDREITLHFLLMEILHNPEESLSLGEIMEKIDELLSGFPKARTMDSSTVRKKLAEYVREGLILTEKRGKTLYYRRKEGTELLCPDTLAFFSETAPCGVIGSYLLDKLEPQQEHLAYKHHYITQAMDSEILYCLFGCMQKKKQARLQVIHRYRRGVGDYTVVPLRIFISVQNGRQYLMAYHPRIHRIRAFRLDYILEVEEGEDCADFDRLRDTLTEMQSYMWGVSTQGEKQRLEHVEFTVQYGRGEEHIHQRLVREKRCGHVVKLDDHTSCFWADVYDTGEMIPWIRTFLCRIVSIHFSNRNLQRQFEQDLKEMYQMYGVEEENP